MENKQYQVFKEAIELGKQAYKAGQQPGDCPFNADSFGEMGWQLGYEVEISLKEAEQLSPEQIMQASPKAKVNRLPKASQGNCTQYHQRLELLSQREPLSLDTVRPILSLAELSQPSLSAPGCSDDKQQGSMMEKHLASASSVAEQKALLRRKQLYRQRISRSIRTSSRQWQPRTNRAVFESLVRSVIRRVPLPIQQLVERIYPRFSPYYVMPLDEFAKGDLIMTSRKD